MFLKSIINNNPELVQFGFKAHQMGLINPDTYLLDLDCIVENGKKQIEEAKKYNVQLYFMLKQIGRNPYVAQELMKVGFSGAVAVDFDEALIMKKNNIKNGHIGHLVQIPKNVLKELIEANPEIITVYSLEKISEINEVARELNMVQPVMIRIMDSASKVYSGQVGGFELSEIENVAKFIEKCKHVKLGGITVFPALLFDSESCDILPTENAEVLLKGKQILEKMGYTNLQINVPSCTCVHSIPLISKLSGTHGEPGHGLTGTTPLHKHTNQPEKIGYVYISEVSHNYKEKSYCYGGGNYRRGHLESAIVGTSIQDSKFVKTAAPDMDSIDYHFELSENTKVGDTVVMCFRTQVFTTRSKVAVIKGLSKGKPEIVGIYSSLGVLIEK